MPQEHTPAEIKAEVSSEDTKQFVHRMRRVTRRKFGPESRKRENGRLKQLVAEHSLEVVVLLKTAIPEFD